MNIREIMNRRRKTTNKVLGVLPDNNGATLKEITHVFAEEQAMIDVEARCVVRMAIQRGVRAGVVDKIDGKYLVNASSLKKLSDDNSIFTTHRRRRKKGDGDDGKKRRRRKH